MSDPYMYSGAFRKMFRNQSDRLQLRISNYIYNFEKEEKGQKKQKILVWKCKDPNCAVRIRTDDDGNNEIFIKGMKHNHDGTF